MAKFPPLDLWAHQQEDLDAIDPEWPNTLFAWDMGTGKTHIGIARDRQIRFNENPNGVTLVVAPLAVHDSWQEKFQSLTPLTVRRVDPKNRHDLFKKKAHVYIVHWEALRLMPQLQDLGFQHVIADEVHRAKNRKSAQTKALKKIPALYKTGLSGTPATNAPQDLWSILNWLYPYEYRSYWKFYTRYVDYDIVYPHGYHKINGPKNERELQDRISPFYFRRLKSEVLNNLPDKVYSRIWVDLTPEQRRAYDQMNEEMIAWIGEHQDEPLIAPVVIAKLSRLQQFALAYLSWDDDEGRYVMTDPSSKLDALMELIADNPSEQMVVFSQWKSPLKLAAQRLTKAKIPYAMYTGDESNVQRADSKQRFIDGRARILLASVGAGGEGVDGLQQAAATAVFLDRDWSPSKNFQAEDRLHRGGQTRTVQVIDIMARNTVDLGRAQRLEQKWNWIQRLLGDLGQADLIEDLDDEEWIARVVARDAAVGVPGFTRIDDSDL